MARVEQTQGFYQKMAELQEKLKKSEEERLKLEEKFVLMMKSCREEEEMRIRALRDKYERFLEEDKRRRDRNERILQTLDRIESRAGALSAKSERLKLLRKHYEAYLIKMYPLWKNPPKYPEEKLPYPAPSLETLRSDFQLNNFRPDSALSQTSSPWQLPAYHAPVPPHVPERNGHWPRASSPTAIPPFGPAPPFDKTTTAVAPGDPVVNGYRVPPGQDAEVKTAVPVASNPVLDGALDGYLHRAAEILRVPVQELDATSEKRDEEKSVHTEQDTSRDLLGVSLSDDNDSAAKEELEMPCEPAIEARQDEPTGDNNRADAVPEPAAATAIDAGAGGDTTLVQAPPVPEEARTAMQMGHGEAGDFLGEFGGETVDQLMAEAVPKPAEPETTHRSGPGAVPGGEAARSTQGPADCLDTQAGVAPQYVAESHEQHGASVAIQEEEKYASELGQQEGAGDAVDYDPAENVELTTHDDTVSQGHADKGNEEWYTQEQVQGDSEMIAEYDDTTEQGENVPQAYNDNAEENYTDQPYTQGQEYTENADQYANNELENDPQYDCRETTEPQGTDDAETYPDDVQYNENVEQPQVDDGQQFTEQDYAEDPQQPYTQQQYSENLELPLENAEQTQSVPADQEEAFVEGRQQQQAGDIYPDQPQQDTEQFPENILQDTGSEVLQENPSGAEKPDMQGETRQSNEDGAIEGGRGKEGGVVGSMVPPEGEEESEESSSSFWNPPGRKVRGEIPSVDELASNAPAAAPEDSSESSVDSRQHPTTTTVPSEGGAQPLRKLLGAPTDAAGEPSDADDVEDELAALIQGQPTSGIPQSAAEVSARPLQSEAKPPVRTPSSPKTQAPKKNKSQKSGGISDKPAAKATSKKLPALNRVLESDTESLNLDAGAGSNVDSDEFDFSTE